MAQSVRHPALGFGLGHGLRVVRLSPHRAPHWAWSLFKILSHTLSQNKKNLAINKNLSKLKLILTVDPHANIPSR